MHFLTPQVDPEPQTLGICVRGWAFACFSKRTTLIFFIPAELLEAPRNLGVAEGGAENIFSRLKYFQPAEFRLSAFNSDALH